LYNLEHKNYISDYIVKNIFFVFYKI